MSAHSAGAYTATLLVMVNVKRGGGRAPPTHTSQGQFYPHHWMYARKQRLQLCVLCGYNNLEMFPSCTDSLWPGIIKLFPVRKSLVSDIPAGDGKTANLFLQCYNNKFSWSPCSPAPLLWSDFILQMYSSLPRWMVKLILWGGRPQSGCKSWNSLVRTR